MSSALLIAQICLVGILGLKEVPAEAVLVVPLPILTLIFDRSVSKDTLRLLSFLNHVTWMLLLFSVSFCGCRYIHNAIKVKLKSLPLSQLVEIDATRKKERMEREKMGADSGANSPRVGDKGVENGGVDLTVAKQMEVRDAAASPVAVDQPKSTLQMDQRSATELSAPGVATKVDPTPVQESKSDESKSEDGPAGARIRDETRNTTSLGMETGGGKYAVPNLVPQTLPAGGVQQLGFPYEDEEQVSVHTTSQHDCFRISSGPRHWF
jgi:hypothetical protein